MTPILWMTLWSVVTLGGAAAFVYWALTAPEKPHTPAPHKGMGPAMAIAFSLMLLCFFITGSNIVGWIIVLFA